ncbi:hypothetical protein [Spirillospora sp. NBC_01491]|uniref:hypothetical protein n=1 Tax=Spirillospora sp. NBC_01491 TaxID=2976007 RepID=UPI002E3437AF|nr:hypothetical protein [Spirillospora sp. NBC_01491]
MISSRFRTCRRSFAAAVALGTAVGAAALSAAPAAQAARADDPVPDFDWSDCPELPPGANVPGSICLQTTATSGSFTLGGAEHAITRPITVTAGSASFLGEGFQDLFGAVRSEDFTVDLGPGIGTASVSLQYAGGLVLRGFDTTIGLKVKLSGAGLGDQCTIGSDAAPILLNLTTGTTAPPPPNQPISGEPFTIIGSIPNAALRKGTQVDNAFALPGATGCGTGGQSADAAVNAAVGLPSAAGRNTVIFHEYGAAISYSKLP